MASPVHSGAEAYCMGGIAGSKWQSASTMEKTMGALWGPKAHECNPAPMLVNIGGGKVRNAAGKPFKSEEMRDVHWHISNGKAKYWTNGPTGKRAKEAMSALQPPQELTNMHWMDVFNRTVPTDGSTMCPWHRVETDSIQEQMARMGVHGQCEVVWTQLGNAVRSGRGQTVKAINLQSEAMVLGGPAGVAPTSTLWRRVETVRAVGNLHWDDCAAEILTRVGHGEKVALAWGTSIKHSSFVPYETHSLHNLDLPTVERGLSCWNGVGTHMVQQNRGRKWSLGSATAGIAAASTAAHHASRPGLIYCRGKLAVEASTREIIAHGVKAFGHMVSRKTDGLTDIFAFVHGYIAFERRHGFTAAHMLGDPSTQRDTPEANAFVWPAGTLPIAAACKDTERIQVCSSSQFLRLLELFAHLSSDGTGNDNDGSRKGKTLAMLPVLRETCSLLHLPGGHTMIDMPRLLKEIGGAINGLPLHVRRSHDFERVFQLIQRTMPSYQEAERCWVASASPGASSSKGSAPNQKVLPTVNFKQLADWFHKEPLRPKHTLIRLDDGKMVDIPRVRSGRGLVEIKVRLTTTCPKRMQVSPSRETNTLIKAIWPKFEKKDAYWQGRRIMLLGLATYLNSTGTGLVTCVGPPNVSLTALESVAEIVAQFTYLYDGHMVAQMEEITAAEDMQLAVAINSVCVIDSELDKAREGGTEQQIMVAHTADKPTSMASSGTITVGNVGMRSVRQPTHQSSQRRPMYHPLDPPWLTVKSRAHTGFSVDREEQPPPIRVEAARWDTIEKELEEELALCWDPGG